MYLTKHEDGSYTINDVSQLDLARIQLAEIEAGREPLAVKAPALQLYDVYEYDEGSGDDGCRGVKVTAEVARSLITEEWGTADEMGDGVTNGPITWRPGGLTATASYTVSYAAGGMGSGTFEYRWELRPVS